MWQILQGDARRIPLRDESVHCVVTSPPYWSLRDYGVDGQLGLEPTIEQYIENMVQVFRDVKRVLRPMGTCWVNLGDTYYQGNKGFSGELRPTDKQATNAGSLSTRRGKSLGPNRQGNEPSLKHKDLCGIPWRVAFALQADGWWLRQDVIWAKPNPMPESVTDRCTKSHEYIFLLTKSERYFWDAFAVRENLTIPSRAANGTSLSSSTLTPEADSTIETDNSSPYFGGRCDLSQSQITIDGSMTWETENFKVLQSIRFSIVFKETKREFVMDLQPHRSSASLTEIMSTLQCFSLSDAPVRATIIDASSAKRGVSASDSIGTIPSPTTPLTAESMFQPLALLTDIAEKCFPAFLTFDSKELRTPLLIFGTFRSSHSRDHDTRNTRLYQGRNLRSVWTIASEPFSSSHFAVFPTALVARCIKAGTSEKGCCPQCGKPWVREMEKEQTFESGSGKSGNMPIGKNGARLQGGGETLDIRRGPVVHSLTTGWQPTCSHDLPPLPCMVFDPFSGAGTVPLVADRLGRSGIGLDLKQEYCEMARDRIAQETPLFATLTEKER